MEKHAMIRFEQQFFARSLSLDAEEVYYQADLLSLPKASMRRS